MHAAATIAPPYTTPVTGNTFFLNTTASAYLDAERACTTNGGHLAWYVSAAEQYDVEMFYIKGEGLTGPWQGYDAIVVASQPPLLPARHRIRSMLHLVF